MLMEMQINCNKCCKSNHAHDCFLDDVEYDDGNDDTVDVDDDDDDFNLLRKTSIAKNSQVPLHAGSSSCRCFCMQDQRAGPGSFCPKTFQGWIMEGLHRCARGAVEYFADFVIGKACHANAKHLHNLVSVRFPSLHNICIQVPASQLESGSLAGQVDRCHDAGLPIDLFRLRAHKRHNTKDVDDTVISSNKSSR